MSGGQDGRLGHAWLVGAGPGDPGLITVAGVEALRRAEVVLYDRLAPHELLDEAPREAMLIDVGKAAGDHTMTQEEINAALVEHGLAGRRVVRLKGGDPYVFGRGGEEAVALATAGVPCTVVPGITSAIGGLARGGIPVTHRGLASSFAVITGHEDPTKPEAAVHWERLATAVDTLVILMGVGRLDGIAQALIEGGRPAETPAALVQDAATPGQRVATASLGRIAEVAREAGIRAPALFVVGDVAGLQSILAPARLAPLAGKQVLITRTRTQASALADLLRAEGAHPVLLPAIEVERRVDDRDLAKAVHHLDLREYRWVVFTSANAVDAFLDVLLDRGEDVRLLGGANLCAIGDATARALRARGLRADMVPADADGEGVVDALRRQPHDLAVTGARVLLPRAEGARDVLPQGLREVGATVDELTLYLAAPPAEPPAGALDLVRSGGIDVATFTSSSTVTNLAGLLGGDLSPLRDAVIACIGPVVAKTAEEHGLRVDVVAEDRSMAGLVEALRRYLHSRQTTSEEAR
ncbi:MAG: uroporphyrinogen-III C-methyltransferase [Dehalococcoidia bacterium]|nr:uroporphyrinogen-III C-methyltransferase [Dehalococcoidia bacterium]